MEEELVEGTPTRAALVVEKAVSEPLVDLVSIARAQPDRVVVDLRVVKPLEESINHTVGEGPGILAREARHGALPIRTERIVRVLDAADRERGIELPKEHVRM
jgi:hypothetical protein